MKHLPLFIFLTFHMASAHAQKPQMSIYAHGGIWRPWVRFEDPYATNSRARHPQAGLGMGLGFLIAKPLLFSPELGLEYYGLHQKYGSARDPRDAIASLELFYARVSPGFTLRAKHFWIRGALNMICAAFTTGEYSIRYVDHDLDEVVTLKYADHFSRIRNPLLIGPELCLGANLFRMRDAVLGVRLSGFASSAGVFRQDFWTHFNPRIGQINLGIVYNFSNKSD